MGDVVAPVDATARAAERPGRIIPQRPQDTQKLNEGGPCLSAAKPATVPRRKGDLE